jgi:hypothetical protein
MTNEEHARAWNRAAEEAGRSATPDEIWDRAVEIDPSGAEAYERTAKALGSRR